MDYGKVDIRGVNFDNVSLSEAASVCLEKLNDGKCFVVYTPNSEIVQLCIERKEYYEIINSADMIIPDGAGIIMASKILKKPLKKGKVAGIELFEKIIEMCSFNDKKVFLLGGKPGVAEKAEKTLCEKYPKLQIVGINDGYFKKTGKESTGIIEKINSSGADFLAVCLGVPAQEEWLYNNKQKLNVKLAGGFGGSLDVFAGEVKRAPKLFIKLQLEWFYRLIKQPWRIVRMMKLPKFILGCIFSK